MTILCRLDIRLIFLARSRAGYIEIRTLTLTMDCAYCRFDAAAPFLQFLEFTRTIIVNTHSSILFFIDNNWSGHPFFGRGSTPRQLMIMMMTCIHSRDRITGLPSSMLKCVCLCCILDRLCSFIQSLRQSLRFVHSLIDSPIHSLIHSPHSLTHSLAHSLTHSRYQLQSSFYEVRLLDS